MQERYCGACGALLQAKHNESISVFRKRKFCDRHCYARTITKHDWRGKGRPADPTPNEIRERCATIRAGWSERQERDRRVIHDVPAQVTECQLVWREA